MDTSTISPRSLGTARVADAAPTPSEHHDRTAAHAIARIGFGVNILLHGLTRLPQIDAFAANLVKQFEATFLPGPFVQVFASLIVYGETLVGAFLVIGFLLRVSLLAGAVLLIALIFGTNLVQSWNTAGLQLSYLAFYAVLLATARYDRYSLDGLIRWRNGRR